MPRKERRDELGLGEDAESSLEMTTEAFAEGQEAAKVWASERGRPYTSDLDQGVAGVLLSQGHKADNVEAALSEIGSPALPSGGDVSAYSSSTVELARQQRSMGDLQWEYRLAEHQLGVRHDPHFEPHEHLVETHIAAALQAKGLNREDIRTAINVHSPDEDKYHRTVNRAPDVER